MRLDALRVLKVLGNVGQNRDCPCLGVSWIKSGIEYNSCFHVRVGSGEASARISSRSVWTEPGTKVDKNNKGWCMVHG